MREKAWNRVRSQRNEGVQEAFTSRGKGTAAHAWTHAGGGKNPLEDALCLENTSGKSYTKCSARGTLQACSRACSSVALQHGVTTASHRPWALHWICKGSALMLVPEDFKELNATETSLLWSHTHTHTNTRKCKKSSKWDYGKVLCISCYKDSKRNMCWQM